MKLTFFCLAVLGIFACSSESKNDKVAEEKATPPVDTTTRMRIVNNSDSPVTVYLTLGATPGCLQHISQVPFVTDSAGSIQGWFTLAAGDSTVDYAPLNMGYNGNISFNTPPLNCPTQQFPAGVNIFEFILNNTFQPGTPQHTIDISCVAGVNCLIKVNLSGGKEWNAGPLFPNVTSIYNSRINENTGLTGVYPYGCDICTASQSPPTCITTPANPQTQPICNVQRNAIGSGGGLIRVEYGGAMN